MIGKIAGAFIGYVLYKSWVGAIVGIAIGHFFDNAMAARRRPAIGGEFIGPLFAFAGAVSKSDGRVSESEIAATEALMARLRLDEAQRRTAIDRFTAGKQADFEVGGCIEELRAWCRGRRDLAFTVLDLLLDLVHAEGPMVGAKLGLVHRLCAALGISDHELAALSAMKGYGFARSGARGGGAGPGSSQGSSQGYRAPPQRPSDIDPYAVLGVDRSANEREIKQAYRRLMSQHHPDKLGSVPDEMKRRAEERAREINAAYERIKEQRGIR